MIRGLFKRAHSIPDHMVINFQFSAIGFSYEFVFCATRGFIISKQQQTKILFIYTVVFIF